MIKTIIKRVNEVYTSKISYISSDIFNIQEYSNNSNDKSREESSCTHTCTIKPKYNSKRIKRGLFKDTIINKIFNTDLNGTVNHIKIAIKKSFQHELMIKR